MQEFIPSALNSLPNWSSEAIWESNSWRMEAWRTGVNHSTAHNEHRDIIRGREFTESNYWVGYGSIWPSWRTRGKSFCAHKYSWAGQASIHCRWDSSSKTSQGRHVSTGSICWRCFQHRIPPVLRYLSFKINWTTFPMSFTLSKSQPLCNRT